VVFQSPALTDSAVPWLQPGSIALIKGASEEMRLLMLVKQSNPARLQPAARRDRRPDRFNQT